MSLKIILADDHKIMREGLRSLLEKHPDMTVIAEAGDGRTAVQLAQRFSPDVVVMDISMPELNGIEATRKILAAKPEVKVIALSMHSDQLFIAKMLKAGVSAYLLKDCAFGELADAIQAVLKNKTYLSRGIDTLAVNDFIRQLSKAHLSLLGNLTSREREVLQLIAEGLSTKQIAFHIGLSVKTIETHRLRLMRKLKAKNIASLIKIAIQEGLITIDT